MSPVLPARYAVFFGQNGVAEDRYGGLAGINGAVSNVSTCSAVFPCVRLGGPACLPRRLNAAVSLPRFTEIRHDKAGAGLPDAPHFDSRLGLTPHGSGESGGELPLS